MNALTLSPSAAAFRRTCLPSRSSSEIVILMMQIIFDVHNFINPEWMLTARSGCEHVRSRLLIPAAAGRAGCAWPQKPGDEC